MTTTEIDRRAVLTPVGPIEYVKYSGEWSKREWFADRCIPKGKKNWTKVERVIRRGKRAGTSYYLVPEHWLAVSSYMMNELDWYVQ